MILFRKISFWLALGGLLSVGLLVHRLRAQLDEPMPPLPLEAPAKPFSGGIGAAGLVEALGENVAVSVPLSGVVLSVEVAVWDKVEAGQPLLQLDDREVRAYLATLRTQVTVAEASLARITGQAERLEAVVASKAVAREELIMRRSDIDVAKAQLEAARASVSQQEVLLDRLTVRAPRAGTILQVNTRPGEYATPGTATPPLFSASSARCRSAPTWTSNWLPACGREPRPSDTSRGCPNIPSTSPFPASSRPSFRKNLSPAPPMSASTPASCRCSSPAPTIPPIPSMSDSRSISSSIRGRGDPLRKDGFLPQGASAG